MACKWHLPPVFFTWANGWHPLGALDNFGVYYPHSVSVQPEMYGSNDRLSKSGIACNWKWWTWIFYVINGKRYIYIYNMVFYDVVPPFFGGGVFVLGSTVISWAHKPSGQGWAAVPVDYKPTRQWLSIVSPILLNHYYPIIVLLIYHHLTIMIPLSTPWK